MTAFIKTLALTLFIGLSAASTFAQKEGVDRGYLVKVGDTAPDFETTFANGHSFKLSDQKGKVVMLQFTASWCGVCRKEMPFIEREIWQELKGKDFVLVGVDKDEPLEKVKEFKAQMAITYPLGLDPESKIFEKYAHKKAGVTRNIIINRDGKIIYLTRLFNKEEFDAMKKVIFNEVNSN
ncbi:MAG: TlpA disulfide reductase family protein [Salinivirgaceae bacterium]|jgi:peroxiredoxin|nr:TlpA disulfide reductase family protein [Salinivirgaceae bacterium]